MDEIMKKPKGKCIPYVINDEVRKRIRSFSEMLAEMKNDYGSMSEQARTIDIILNELDAFDRNFIIAYYEYGESPSILGKLFGVSPAVILSRVKKIIKTIQEKL